MEKQNDNPKTMKNSKEREKIKFNVGGGGGFIVIGATVVAAAIAAAFVAYRDKRCRKEGGDRTIKNGADEKAEEGLKAVHENANQKHEAMEDTTEDNFEHEDGEKLEDGSEEEFSFGSLIKIQETKSDMAKEEIIETRCNDGKNDTADDFSFWNNSLNNHKETEDVDKEALEKSEERTDGVFELEEEEHTSMEQRNGHTFVVTSEKSENENYEQRVGNTQTEKEKVGEKKDGDAFAYVGVEVEQQSKEDCITNTELVDEEESNKVIDNANVVNAEENEKGEDTQMALKERDEKDKYEEVQGNITYIEVEGKVADREETFAQNEERRVDGKGNTEAKEYDEDNIILKDIADSETTIVSIEMEKQVEESGINVEHREIEENTVLYLNLKSIEEQEKARDFTLIDVREENGQNGIDYIQEEGNKVREEEKQDNTNVKVDGKTVKEEDQEDIRHDEEERMAMEKENQNQYRDDTEVEIEVVQEKEENEGQKGVDNVDSSEINNEQNGEYIIVGEGSYEDMKLVKTVENQEKIDENAYTELSKGNNADDVYNAVHAQQTHEEEEEDDVENGRENDIVGNEIDVKEVAVNKELNEVEEKGGKTGVAKGVRDVVDKEQIKEQNDSVILKEMDNDVEVDMIEVQLVEKESRDTALTDEVDKEIMDITKEKDNKMEEKEQDDITDAEAGVFKLREEEFEDPSHVEEEKEEERNVIENEKEDKNGNDSNINVGVKLVEGYDIISVENNPKEDETANAEINEVETDEAKGGDIAQEVETKTANEMQHKKTEEKIDEMNKEIPGDGFAAFQQVNNMEKEDHISDHIKNENAKENAECLMLEKEKKTTYMSMDHISEGLFLLVFAISIAVGILAIFADQDNLPRCFRQLFQFFFPSFK